MNVQTAAQAGSRFLLFRVLALAPEFKKSKLFKSFNNLNKA